MKVSLIKEVESGAADKIDNVLMNAPHPEYSIVSDEWSDPYHRHMSQLVGLYPGNLITRETPAFLNGAKVVLNNRGDEATGWSIANKFLMWARVLDGDKALQLFRYQLAQRTYPNLFDYHSPFQIDGNFGAAAGVMELLVQSQTGTVYILPALPKLWDTGSVSGIRSKTGVEIGIDWTNNKATQITMTPSADGDIKLGYSLANTIYVSDGGAVQTISTNDSIFVIPGAKKDVKLTITFTPNTANNEIGYSGNFKLYPNPTNGIIHIKTDNKYVGSRLEITDLKGMLIADTAVKSINYDFDLSKIVTNGTYLVSLIYKNEKAGTQKIVVNK